MRVPRVHRPLRAAIASLAALAALFAAPAARAQIVETPEFFVATATNVFTATAGADGNFLVALYRFESSGRRIYTRLASTSGVLLTDETRVDHNGRLTRPEIVAAPSGYWMVGQNVNASSSLDKLYGMRLDALGARVGNAFRIDSEADSGSAVWGRVALLSSGPIFAWQQFHARTRRYSTGGTALEEPQQASQTQASGFFLGVVSLASGGHVVAWRNIFTASMWGRTFDAQGNPVGDQYLLGEGTDNERIASSPSGGFGIAVVKNSTEVWSRRFDDFGAPASDWVFLGDVAPAQSPRFDLDFDFQGNAFVLWSGFFSSGSPRYSPLLGRVLDSATYQPTGPAAEISSQGYYAVTSRLADGRFVNVWNRTGSALYANVVSICGGAQATCGNGVLEAPCEICDDGAGNSDTAPDACRTSCRPAACGDAVIDSGEECDDGGRQSGDGCDQNCLAEFCGNGRREAGEGCDDGNQVDGDGCDSNCTATACGNGVLTGAEECDDGNVAGGDGCDAACLIEECGNGRPESSEECDDGNTEDGDGCDSNCTLSRCGNGILGIDEECDDGNVLDGDGCDRACLVEECGNGRLEGAEACDDGNLEAGDGCEADCRPTPVIDAVLAPLRPLRIPLSPLQNEVTKRVRLVVRNADSIGLQILRVTASDDTCPPGTVSAPDFDRGTAGSQDVIALAPRERLVGSVEVRVTRAAFGGLGASMPRRCTVRLAVGPSSVGAVDARPENNTALLLVDVYDRGAASAGEFHLGALRPQLVRIPNGNLAAQRDVRVRARSAVAGSIFSLAAEDGDCPPGTVSLVEVDPDRGTAKVRLRASRAFFTTPSGLSPGRCTAWVVAESQPDGDPANNAAPVLLDVVDMNDR